MKEEAIESKRREQRRERKELLMARQEEEEKRARRLHVRKMNKPVSKFLKRAKKKKSKVDIFSDEMFV